MTEGKDRAYLFDDLEEALRKVRGVAEILMKIGDARSQDAFISGFLGEQLFAFERQGHEAFESLHDLVVGPEVIDDESGEGVP